MVPSDEELMQAYQAGDSLAFETLYLRSSPKLYGYLRKKLSRSNEVEDVFQRVFLKLHRTRSDYDPKYLFEQWLFVIARTAVLDHFRMQQRSNAVFTDQDVSELSDRVTIDGEREHVELPSLGALTAEQRQVIELKVIDDLTYEQIATRLRRSETSVRQLFSRAVRKLRVEMKRGSES